MTFTCVYILQSELNPRRFYTGCARDLRDRLNRHNSGKMVHTAKWKPWRIKTYIAVSDRKRARDLESYLKSGLWQSFYKKASVILTP
jgi:putative endonuclease